MTLTIISTLVLILLSGFFSASETAITAASRPLMYQLEQSGNRRAAVVNRLRARTDRVLGAILLGNNLVNILASSLATSALIVLFGDAGVAYATAGMTLLVLVFGEVLPKTYAVRRANHVVLRVAPVLVFLVRVLAPITATISVFVQGLLRLARGACPRRSRCPLRRSCAAPLRSIPATRRRARNRRCCIPSSICRRSRSARS